MIRTKRHSLLREKLKEAREAGKLPYVMTPERLARLAFHSTLIEYVDECVMCSYEKYLEYARILMNKKE